MEQRRAETTHGRAPGHAQQAGKWAVLHTALAAIHVILTGESPTHTADFLLLPDGVTAGSLSICHLLLLFPTFRKG